MGRRIAVIGNCQADTLTRFIRTILPESEVQLFTHGDATDAGKRKEKEAALARSEIVFSQPLRSESFGAFSFNALSVRENSYFFPPFSFPAFHPDCVYIGLTKAVSNTSPVGDYSSSIVAYSYLSGLTVDETVQMFNETVYRKLGFFDIWDASRDVLLGSFEKLGHDLSEEFDSWTKRGLFMHTINHPYTFVSADIARKLLSKLGLADLRENVTKFVSDRGADDIVWPVYPEIGERLGIKGELIFKVSDRHVPADKRPCVIDLHEFIHGSFGRYKEIGKEALICRSTAKSHDESLEIMAEIITNYRRNGARVERGKAGDHPYKQIQDHQFWRRAISSVAPKDVDPVVSSALKIRQTDKVATAGSCFAQHIASRLKGNGFAYLVTEAAPADLTAEAAKARNFGVFSARYGNVYTARQLVQLFDRAHGTFEPNDSVWTHPELGFVDPFRPQIEPDGFPTEAAVLASRKEHFASVRKTFKEADIFVFTLGLTEGWQAKQDGAVFPLAPGVAGGFFDAERYEFVNYTAQAVADDLIQFITRLRQVNPLCRVLLTVSPVPLVATFVSKHVLVSTTYSKSVLRVAAETACNATDNVFYFPSYEIITGNYNKGAYFEEDMRSVTTEGVDHVMGLFFKHLTSGTNHGKQPAFDSTPAPSAPIDKFADRMSKLDEVVCDEEALDR
ncbi:GSCFA domain-containing protein [Sinorhizobium fredii]|uniref:GSCFA domain-containing protein n=1 Tax=Rhizobium fredii TaxID=380 RepID=UPI00210CE4AB|nr:GSCFA domain-containing protein [Sinorhizobium fredii]UTY46693.1 hypothetical protein EPK84_07450 [Sinorhizobium fredii]